MPGARAAARGGAPVSVLGNVRGFARDFAIDAMPDGFLWDICDFILNRRGLRLAYRSGYVSLGPVFTTAPTGGLHASYQAGPKLIVESGGSLYDVNPSTGARSLIGAPGFGLVMNGTMLRNRAFFCNATPGATVPYYASWNGSAWAQGAIDASAPKGSVAITYKDRLVVAGTGDQNVYFSPPQGPSTPSGALGAWDSTSVIGVSNTVRALAAMSSQILVFHDGAITRIRGTIPPALGVQTDMYVDTLSDHIGCPNPASVCHWLENVIWADPNGVQMTDGASIRCLTDQGGLHSYWYDLYRKLRPGAQVHADVFQDQLVVFLPTTIQVGDLEREDYPTMLLCDLNNRVWYRFSNIYPSCLVATTVGSSDIMWYGDGYTGGNTSITPTPLSLSSIAPLLNPLSAQDPNGTISLVQQYDGDGDPVLPHLETGWTRIAGDVPKQFVNLYISHQIQVDHAISPTTPVARLAFTVEPLVQYMDGDPSMSIVPGSFYTRDRFDLQDSGYGARVAFDAIAAVGVGGLFDIQIQTSTVKDPGSLR